MTKDSQVLKIGRGPLLNFYMREIALPHPITGQFVVFASVEHYFQAMKAMYMRGADSQRIMDRFELVREQVRPNDAKNIGRGMPINLMMWNRSSFGHMLQGHIAKFSQHADLRGMLLNTGSKKLVEHRPDPVWGDNMDGTGKNLCGRSLMIVRRLSQGWA